MSILQRLRSMLTPDTDRGVKFECSACGETFESDHATCPNCGSDNVVERESFEMRPE
ncbi:zinc ribbon domain-containing protein [Halobium salinum]|uniref:Zinc ribbon domain-containing protein n=1 Tax=Halobium salinum TaxID=1364940 RepID=A0ABD5PCK6_9EURY|nr:hypothetical protein [Halobium salinum]